MSRKNIKQKIFRSALFSLLISPLLGYSAAIQLFEQSANSLGYSHADMAALADDASTAYFNPAGMNRIMRPQVSIGGAFADIRNEFDGSIQFVTPPLLNPLDAAITNLITGIASSQNLGLSFGENVIWTNTDITYFPPPTSPRIVSGENVKFKIPRAKGDSHPVAPFFHFVIPLLRSADYDATLGLSLVVPFGGETNYQGQYVQTYCADNSYQQVSLNPTLAGRYKKLSLGGGISYNIVKDYYSERLINSGGEIYFSNADPSFRRIDLQAKASLWTWNIAALYEFTPEFRIGATYRSRFTERQQGDFNALYESSKAHTIFRLPDTFTAGFYYDFNPRFALMGSFAFTWWHKFSDVFVTSNIPSFQIAFQGVDVTANPIDVPLQFKNTAFFALGGKFVVSDDLLFKFGLSYDRSPTVTRVRELRIPDNDRYGISTGIRYDVNDHLTLDVAYQFLFSPRCGLDRVPMSDVSLVLDNGDGTFTSLPNCGAYYEGSNKLQAQLFSIQASWTF